MLTHISVSNIVLIDRLELDIEPGLTVLTGETGAGKSILLDALSLATGGRADRLLVRQGTDKASVTVVFDVPPEKMKTLQNTYGESLPIADSHQIILRRELKADGRSKCFINDTVVSANTLKQLGQSLLEIHGQQADQGLMNPASHRLLLDRYGIDNKMLRRMSQSSLAWDRAQNDLKIVMAEISATRAQEDFLRHALDELNKLAPEKGEEQSLAEKRALMMRGAKLVDALAELYVDFTHHKGLDAQLRSVARKADRLAEQASDLLEPVQAGLNRATIEIDEVCQALESLKSQLDYDSGEVDGLEERLFEYRRLARKHDCTSDDLVLLQEKFSQQLLSLDRAEAGEHSARIALEKATNLRAIAADELSKARSAQARKLDQAVNAELAALKLGGAEFRTYISLLPEGRITEEGQDQIYFQVKTNKGSAFGPMTKIASGGELARFMLALKVVLASADDVSVIVFDEVDRGVGGATAAAVAERLHDLSKTSQVMLVTHSPQVAARGDYHLQISKQDRKGTTRTSLDLLDKQGRREELARMLSGAEISSEARSAAEALLSVNQAV